MIGEAPQGVQSFYSALRSRLLMRYAIETAAILAIGLALTMVQLQVVNTSLMRLITDAELELVSDDLIDVSGPGLTGEIALQDLPYDRRYVTPISGRYFQIASCDPLQAQIISPSLFDTPLALPVETCPETGDIKFFDARAPEGEPLRLGLRTFEVPELEGRYLVVVAISTMGLAPVGNGVAVASALAVIGMAVLWFLFRVFSIPRHASLGKALNLA